MARSMFAGTRSEIRSRGYKPTLVALAAAFIFVAFNTKSASAQDSSPLVIRPRPGLGGQLVVGKADFDEYCSGCHGSNGTGNGANDKTIPGVKPTDLTRIAARNGGVFPANEVADAIDGKKPLPSHQRFDMPFWGGNCQASGKESSPASAARAKARIDMIVSYIKTMQVE